MSQRQAWTDSDVLIIKGLVSRARHDGQTAYYEIQVSGVLKPQGGTIPKNITIVDPHYMSTAMVRLKEEETVVLFAKKGSDEYYWSCGELHLDAPSGAEKFGGLSLFLKLMSISDKTNQRQQCLASWDDKLSDPEKEAILDVMWETRCSDYTDLLIDIAKGQDSPRLRSWAITILAYVDKSERSEELVGLLDDPDYDVKRQLMLFFGAHKVKAAVPKIEKLLREDIKAPSESQADALRNIAREALDKITGKNTSPYWKY